MTDWRDQAACRDTDREAFFPGKCGNGAAAKLICSTCPVRAACLEDAIQSGDTYAGIRGGMAAEDRRRLCAARQRQRVDRTADILRLHGKRWPAKQIASRYGIGTEVVWRALKAHRAKLREEAA